MTAKRKSADELRSHRWLGRQRSCARSGTARGCARWATTLDDWKWQASHRHHQHLERHQPVPRASARARRGRQARHLCRPAAFPLELPAMSLSEPFVKPSAMLYRNFLAMETEELLRSHPDRRRRADGRLRQDHARPADGRDQRWGCPRSTCRPARCCAATGAAKRSARAPTPGNTGTRSAPAASPRSSGRRSRGGIARSFGTCMTMGTAATMMAIAEAMGFTLPGALLDRSPPTPVIRACARPPAGASSTWCGKDLTPAKILTPSASFDNAIRVHMAMGGSTNAIIHVDRHGAPRRHRPRHEALRRTHRTRHSGARQCAARRAST